MALSGNTLKASLKAAVLTQLQSLFPMPSGLQAAEQTAYALYQNKLAEAVGYGDGPITVAHITSSAVVNSGIAVSVSTGTGIGSTTAPGTVS